MLKIRILGFIAAGIVSVALAAGPDPGVNVTVTNPPTHPVPVNVLGGAIVSGSVTANQGGAWNVSVGNTSTTPLFVNDVTKRNYFLDDGIVGTVPAGKIYVIEHWSIRCNVQATGQMIAGALTAAITSPGTPAKFIEDFSDPHFLGPNGTINGVAVNLYGVSGTPTIRLPAGASFSVAATTTNNALISQCLKSVSGYQVDL